MSGLVLFDIDRDRHIHVQHDGLVDGSEQGSQLDARSFRTQTAPVLACRRIQQHREDEGVAADIPLRLQADPAVSQSDLPDRREVVIVETSGKKRYPVVELGRLGMTYPAVAGEEFHHLRVVPEMGIEGVQDRRQQTFESWRKLLK